MARIALDTYPEPRTPGHDGITHSQLAKVCALVPNGGEVLDVGCGQGPALDWLKEHGFSGTGITINKADLVACRELGHNVYDCDQNALMFNDGWFDMVWARHVLEHSVAPYWTLHEFKRVLKPGGILYVEVPSPNTASCHESNQNHYSVMGYEMWLALITRAGFEPIEGVEMNLKTEAGPDVYFAITSRKS
jgi:ubiquinone/menaquinone biosynthesis C-methylase UbiE